MTTPDSQEPRSEPRIDPDPDPAVQAGSAQPESAQPDDQSVSQPEPQPDAAGDGGGTAPPEPQPDAAGDGGGTAPPPPAAVAGDGRTAEELALALRHAEAERDEYLDHLRRTRAEFDNYRKRTTRERMDALDRGAQALVERMLGVLDNLGFALEAAKTSPDDQLAKGVQMVSSQLLAILHDAGLEEIDSVGTPFDPAVHEAMMQVEATEPVPEPVVAEILRRGYRYKGRVLRPASVAVAS